MITGESDGGILEEKGLEPRPNLIRTKCLVEAKRCGSS